MKEMDSFPQSINKLRRLFVALLCEGLAYVVVDLPHHVAKVAGVSIRCQHFTELGDVPGSISTASIGYIPQGCGIAKEEVGFLWNSIFSRSSS